MAAQLSQKKVGLAIAIIKPRAQVVQRLLRERYQYASGEIEIQHRRVATLHQCRLQPRQATASLQRTRPKLDDKWRSDTTRLARASQDMPLKPLPVHPYEGGVSKQLDRSIESLRRYFID